METNKDIQALIRDLREYASNPGYSHGDYADTMRLAADALAAQPFPAPADLPKPDVIGYTYIGENDAYSPQALSKHGDARYREGFSAGAKLVEDITAERDAARDQLAHRAASKDSERDAARWRFIAQRFYFHDDGPDKQLFEIDAAFWGKEKTLEEMIDAYIAYEQEKKG